MTSGQGLGNLALGMPPAEIYLLSWTWALVGGPGLGAWPALPSSVTSTFRDSLRLAGAWTSENESWDLGPFFSLFRHECMFSHVWPFATPWTEAHQAPLAVEFPRQEHWSELPFPTPEDQNSFCFGVGYRNILSRPQQPTTPLPQLSYERVLWKSFEEFGAFKA